MPWTAKDAQRHDKDANTPKRQRQWAHVGAVEAYWLGFIAADGHFAPRQLRVELCGSDEEHLHVLAGALPGYSSVRRYIRTDGAVDRDKAYLLHTNKGFVQRWKNIKHVPPNWLGEELLPHFWRGMVDGDGWILQRPHGRRVKWRVGLCGEHHKVAAFAEWVAETTGVTTVVRPNKTIYYCDFIGNLRPKLVVAALYIDGPALARKRKAADSLLAYPMSRGGFLARSLRLLEFVPHHLIAQLQAA